MSSTQSSGRGARPGNTNAASHSHHLRNALMEIAGIVRDLERIEAQARASLTLIRAIRRMATEARLCIREGDEVAARRLGRLQAQVSVLRPTASEPVAGAA